MGRRLLLAAVSRGEHTGGLGSVLQGPWPVDKPGASFGRRISYAYPG